MSTETTNITSKITHSQILNDNLLTLEKEKFELLNKLKNYEDRSSQHETEMRRILKRQQIYKENMRTLEGKIKEYRDYRKDLQKKMIYLVQFFCKMVDNTTVYNNNFIGSIGKMMQCLAFGQDFDFSKIQVFNPKNSIEKIFDYLETLKIEKIDFQKVKKSIQKKSQSDLKTLEKLKSLNIIYKNILSKYTNNGEFSKENFNEIMDQFESHKQLLMENTSLLSRKSLNDSQSYMETSLNHSAMSSILEASSLRNGILSLNQTFNLQEALKEDNKELMLLCEELEDKKEDVDLKIKLANKKASRLKKEVDRIKGVVEFKENNLKEVRAKEKKFEDEFERILTQIESLESEEFQNGFYSNLLKSGINVKKKELKGKYDLIMNQNSLLSTSGISFSSNHKIQLKENMSP